MSIPRFGVEWQVPPVFDSFETGSIIAGLGQLARSRDIELRTVPLRESDADRFILRLTIEDLSTGSRRRMLFEPYDRADRFDLRALEAVDVYFKQTLDPRHLAGLPSHLAARIRPGGLTFGARLAGTRRLIAGASLLSATTLGVRALRRVSKRIRADLLQIAGTLHSREWERQGSDRVLPRVVFQTRLWMEEPDGHRAEINRFRVQLVESLRSAFGGGDLIGLLRTPMAERLAPDAILDRKVSRREYARQLRTSLVGVNSHGLDGSPGFKVAECLAAGMAIVSQPLAFELPEPLLPEVHYLPFDTPEECVRQCRSLLDAPELAKQMGQRNLEYYYRNVRPDAAARRLLAQSFADPGTGPDAIGLPGSCSGGTV